jgi:hypothetical protein
MEISVGMRIVGLGRPTKLTLSYQVFSFLGTIPHIHANMMLLKSNVFVTFRNNVPIMDERNKHWSMIIREEDGSKHARIEEDTATRDFRILKPP